jgi:hypothetical protein
VKNHYLHKNKNNDLTNGKGCAREGKKRSVEDNTISLTSVTALTPIPICKAIGGRVIVFEIGRDCTKALTHTFFL